MYGWIVDGISSLFEPLVGQKFPKEEKTSQGSLCAGSLRLESSNRAAKRSYHSIDTNENVFKSEVEAKRLKRDVVLSFVKKTIRGVAGLLRLQRPVRNGQQQAHYEDTQFASPMGIDELHTSFITKSDWLMDKAGGKKHPFKSVSPPVMRKHSGLTDRDRRGSFQLLPSRPSLRLGAPPVEPVSSSFGHSRSHKASLTVEEAIRQNNKEHYRRLLEMVSEKYSKNQPLPFNQSKPQSELSTKSEPVPTWKPFSAKKTGQTVSSGVFSWRNQTPNGRWCAANFSSSFSGPLEDTQHGRGARVAKQKQSTELELSSEVATRLSLAERAPVSEPCPAHSRYLSLVERAPVSEPCPAHSRYLSLVERAPVPEPCPAHSRYTDEDIPRLSKEMSAEVISALAQRDPNLVLSAAFKLRITQKDLTTLEEGSWLNDEVMNFYLSLVMERSLKSGVLKVYSFSTFFFPKLQGFGGLGQTGGHAAVKRWTKAVDLFLCDLILVPLHLGVHWALAVIDLKLKTVKTYDSMGQRHDDICSLLLLYLQEEHRVKKGRELDLSKWTACSLRPHEIPQQKNGSDCGVFACKYADYIAKDRSLTFKQCHMPLFRKLMIWEILNQKLL